MTGRSRPRTRSGRLPDARASAPLDWDEVRTVKPERFTLTTMRKRIDEVGDLTKGMWRYKRSLIPLFAKLDLEPADPNKLESGRRRGSAQRWESEQGGWQSRRAAQRGGLTPRQEVTPHL